jgi:8-oxo-dGTP pyrophosphatase MutT (NUDIX family)
MTDRTLVELRCSAIVFREERLLLLRRRRDGAEDWVLPGGHPRPREGAAACVEREVLEEAGIRIQAPRVAFVLETTDPAGDRRLIEVVFLADERDRRTDPRATEPGAQAVFVPVEDTPGLTLRPPLAGYLRGLHRTQLRSTAPYLGNLWRDLGGDSIEEGTVAPGEPSVPSTRSARLRAAVTTCGAPP